MLCSYRWKEKGNTKLEGSDHAPVFISLKNIPEIQLHNTPPLSTRYCPQVRGCQQTLGIKNILLYEITFLVPVVFNLHELHLWSL